MTRARLAAILAAALVALALIWALGAVAISRPSLDLGDPIVGRTAAPSSVPSTPAMTPTPLPTVNPEPVVTPSPAVTSAPPTSSASEAVPVTKPPAPIAGADDGDWDDDDWDDDDDSDDDDDPYDDDDDPEDDDDDD